MMPFKVRIDPRDTCISDMVCVSICGEVFEMNDEDGKSQIVEQYRVAPDNVAEGIIPDDLKDCAQEAADSCPVNIIHVEPA
ncbi:MAG: ferredoxin [Desulfurococcales archaeon]|nr:ferredoxin [Desulfurococcales archaeon]